MFLLSNLDEMKQEYECIFTAVTYVSDFCYSGDQSDLHVIIFDEIDAICKVNWGAVALLLLCSFFLL